jgi:dipeptidyl aminopeptidase/acylaminoacyl peptidase
MGKTSFSAHLSIEVHAHYCADEGCGFEKPENQIDSIRRAVEWFDKYLKGQ